MVIKQYPSNKANSHGRRATLDAGDLRRYKA